MTRNFYCAQHWDTKPALRIGDVVRALRTHVIGRRAVNVSWDSGRLRPPLSGIFQTWTSQDDFVISPPVDEALVSDWPPSSCGWDEWYFFDSLPKTISVEAYCNWGGVAVGDWRELEFTGLNLEKQLATHQPELVISEGHSIFVIARRQDVLTDFASLVGNPNSS